MKYDSVACDMLRDGGARTIWSTDEYEYEGLGRVPGGKDFPEGGHCRSLGVDLCAAEHRLQESAKCFSQFCACEANPKDY